MAFVSSFGAISGGSVGSSKYVCSSSLTKQNGLVQRSNQRARAALQMSEMTSIEADLKVAQECAEGGCSVEDVQQVLTRLEARRKFLTKELDTVSGLMAKLAGANMSEDRSAVAQVIDAAINIFTSSVDDYPAVGLAPWTMEKPKKKK
uniref:Uncharacterized protein n=1 Tax=Timspurckia oligopyrenoides TaxID=708627 RepID=A0A7S1ERU0_9RHOD|mmetsp:Transcript_3027/g.5356  ORF Transcript_3027/g.5356 Transcript_3027/m.5356 type:complete len:148 (+) Transcript_3027:81-524(+)